jgi:hypothetical protein
MIDLSGLLGLAKAYGIQFAVLAVLLLIIWQLARILLDEERSAQFRALIFRSLFTLTGKRNYEKEYISNDISSRLNLARKRIHFSSEILPQAVRVDWVKDSSGSTYDIGEGQYVICLDPAVCQEQNIVRLTNAVVSRTSLVGIRHLFEKPLEKAVDLNLVRILLSLANNIKAMDWFFQNEYSPSISADAALADWSAKVCDIDERGLFTRILLVEFAQFAKRVFGMTPRSFMTGEIEGLVRFLHALSTKQYGREVPLEYITAYVKIAVLLVADTSKILREGINPYLRSIAIDTERGVDTIYVIIWNKEALGDRDLRAYQEFERKTQLLSKEIQSHSKLRKAGELKYDTIDTQGNKRKAKCIRYLVES